MKKKYEKPETKIIKIEEFEPILQVSGNCDCIEYEGHWFGTDWYYHNWRKCKCRGHCNCTI